MTYRDRQIEDLRKAWQDCLDYAVNYEDRYITNFMRLRESLEREGLIVVVLRLGRDSNKLYPHIYDSESRKLILSQAFSDHPMAENFYYLGKIGE